MPITMKEIVYSLVAGALLSFGQSDALADFNQNWDWDNHKRELSYCINPGLDAGLASAARFAASNISASGTGWTLFETPFPDLPEALNEVDDGGRVRISAGSYQGRTYIRRAMTLEPRGNGLVRIVP